MALTDTLQLSDGRPEGVTMGQSVTDTINFFGGTPTSQRTSAALTATASLFVMTGTSHVANASTTVSGLFGFNSTEIAQLLDAIIEIRATLAAFKLHAGGGTQG